ncbi:MAG: polyketide synthase dehydratase domain-containing protein, partial [Verrucomicrobia bacterium]|nr:polyketide synthase dehydratase domain-containing protein [Verrucomicrobiota bacterium]
SPHPVLSGMIAQCAEAVSKSVQQLPSLRRGVPEQLQMFRALAAVFAAGRGVDWLGVHPEAGRVIRLPNYPWQRKRYWFETSPVSPTSGRAGKLPATRSQIAIHGRRLHSPGIRGFIFETVVDANTTGFLNDHCVFGSVIVPAPLMIEMVLSAGGEAFSSNSLAVADLALQQPLFLSAGRQRIVQLVLDPPADSTVEFKIHSAEIGEAGEPVWTLHASGRLELLSGKQRSKGLNRLEFDSLWSRCTQSFSGDDIYGLFGRKGVHFGPAFRAVQQINLGRGEALAHLALPEKLTRELPNYRVHPVLLDAALQAIALSHLKSAAADETDDVLWLFCGLDRLTVSNVQARRLTCQVVTEPAATGVSDLVRGSARLYDEDGLSVAEIEGAQFRRVTRDSFSTADQRNPQDLLFEVIWRPWSSPAHSLQHEAPDYLPAIERLETRLQADLATHCEEMAPEAEAAVAAALHNLSAQYLTRALRQLGWKPVPGDCFGADELMKRLSILPRHSRLMARMLEILSEEGVLWQNGDVWEVVGPLPAEVTTRTVDDLRNRFPAYHSELDLFGRCAGGLAEVLRGTCDPLQLLFPEGSLESATHVYQDSPMSRTPNGLVCELLRAAIEALPAGRVLRVLEIGAGTGGTTAHLLPLLKGVPCEYVFSDLSKLFLQNARQKFSEFPFVRFSLFDIEQPHATQG